MKNILTVLVALAFVLPAYAAKKPAQAKPVNKHQRFDGTKIADDKPTKPVAPTKKKRK